MEVTCMKNDLLMAIKQHGAISPAEVDRGLFGEDPETQATQLAWWEQVILFLTIVSPIR